MESVLPVSTLSVSCQKIQAVESLYRQGKAAFFHGSPPHASVVKEMEEKGSQLRDQVEDPGSDLRQLAAGRDAPGRFGGSRRDDVRGQKGR